MKLSAAVILSMLSLSANAQVFLDALNSYQKEIQPKQKEPDNSNGGKVSQCAS